MAARKTLVRDSVGVRLIRYDETAGPDRVVSTHYRLSSLRPNRGRVLAAEGEANAAFDQEVAACLADPFVLRLISG